MPPAASSDPEDALRPLLAEPRLAEALQKIRQRCDQRGELTGTLLLLRTPHHHRELLPLKAVFGKALTLNAKSELRIRFDELPQQERWIRALYAVLGASRRDLPAEKQFAAVELAKILERVRLKWPALAPVADELADSATWQKRIREDGAADVQNLLLSVAEIADFLRCNEEPIGVSELGARFCGDSKVLRGGERLTLLRDFLLLLETDLRRCNVVDNPSAIKVTVFGPLLYRKAGVEMRWICDLWQLGESATLSWDNLVGSENWRIACTDRPRVISCENETPFCRMIREREGDVLIYTEGYANAAVKRLYGEMPADADFCHWGDSDHDGLRIAAELGDIQALQLWRCDLRSVDAHRELLIPLNSKNKRRAEVWLKRFPEYRYRGELEYALRHGWLEQERWPTC